jgi:hypothetical protein
MRTANLLKLAYAIFNGTLVPLGSLAWNEML